jgi:hypothetical protein
VAAGTLHSQVVNGELTVISDAGDAITFSCAGGHVKIDGADPNSGVADCSSILLIDISGGPDANLIDLQAVEGLSFPNLQQAQIDGAEGDDTITGSGLADVIFDHSGDDTIDGAGGSDFYGVFFGAVGTVQISDSGPAGESDTLARTEHPARTRSRSRIRRQRSEARR